MVVNMKLIFVATLVASPLVTSCDRGPNAANRPSSERFGISYDDCILRGVTAGLSTQSVELVHRSCSHVWERQSEALATVEASLTGGGTFPQLSFEIQNDGPDVATRVQIGVEFQTTPNRQKLYWTFPLELEPGQRVTLTGSFTGNKVPSTQFSVVSSETQFIRVIPIDKAVESSSQENLTND